MMQNLRNKQHGIGFLGWVSILGVLAFFVLIGLRIFPLYSEKFTILTVMEGVANLPNAKTLSTNELRLAFRKNMDVAASSDRWSDDKIIKKLVNVVTDKKTKKKYIHVAYESRNIFVKDLQFVIEFDHKLELGGSASE
ncbi:MAG: hypothetical protein ACI9ZT_001441 [Gammaproteobacteria bacterium]|jgi:hypothetical protein